MSIHGFESSKSDKMWGSPGLYSRTTVDLMVFFHFVPQNNNYATGNIPLLFYIKSMMDCAPFNRRSDDLFVNNSILKFKDIWSKCI